MARRLDTNTEDDQANNTMAASNIVTPLAGRCILRRMSHELHLERKIIDNINNTLYTLDIIHLDTL